MREILNNPIFQEALVAINDSVRAVDVPRLEPEVASVRLLSQLAGHNHAINSLLLLGEHPKKIDSAATETTYQDDN
jgi:hypothetical protein